MDSFPDVVVEMSRAGDVAADAPWRDSLRSQVSRAFHHLAPTNPSPPLKSLVPLSIKTGTASADASQPLLAPLAVVFGTITSPPLKISPGWNIAAMFRGDHRADHKAGPAVLVLQSHALTTTTQEELERRFPLGMKIAIKEPVFWKVRSSVPSSGKKKSSTASSSPEFITFVVAGSPVNAEPITFLSSGKLASLRQMNAEKLREEGDKLLESGFLDSAAEAYEMSAVRAQQEKNRSGPEKIVLARSSRALCLLHTGRPELAVEEAELALKLDPGHLRSLLTKAMALQELDLDSWAADVLRAAAELHPEEFGPRLLEAEKLAMQSTSGSFSFEEHEYSSGVEIRMCEEPGRGRGVFATRDFKPGEVVLLTRPLGFSGTGHGESFDCRNLVVSLAWKAMRSTRVWRQITHCATLGTQSHREVPEMGIYHPNWTTREEFEAGGGKLASDPERSRVDLRVIEEIVRAVSYHPRAQSSGSTEFTVVWPLPSFINHSCVTNIAMHYVDSGTSSVKFMGRATREIRAGEEILLSYIIPGYPFRRERVSSRWTCRCPRCELEAGLEEELEPVRSCYLNPEESGGRYGFKPGVNFARAVHQLEQVLQQLVESEDDRRSVRCGYWELYEAYYRLGLESGGDGVVHRVPPAEEIMEAMYEHGRGYLGMVVDMELLEVFAVDKERARRLVELEREAELE